MELLSSPFGSVAHSLMLTLEKAKELGETKISISNGVYHVYQEDAAAPVLCVANHGHNGYKSTALAIKDMHNLTIDGNGSTFILHGCMDFAIVHQSHNITIKNLTVTCADTCNFQGIVTDVQGSTVTIQLQEHPPLLQFGDGLFQRIDHQYEPMGRTLNYITATREIRRGTGDENFGMPFNQLRKKLDGDTLYLFDVPNAPPVGDTIVFTISRRCNQAFLLSHSTNILLENITVHTCWGMAFIAQKCRDVTIRRCTVTPERDRCWSAGQDAAHFVNCSGTVIIEESLFENQLDDAVNLHGIYTLISQVRDNQILVRYSHWQTRGIDIYSPGNKLQILDRESQQPLAFAEITEVKSLNPDSTILSLRNIRGPIEPGMIVENLSDEADAYIRNNVFRNNRARGMLIAGKGHIEIIGNQFHSGGAAIQFESDPIKWFECGGVRDVLIQDNDFIDCRHGRWGRAVIDICKRMKAVEDFYYHETIAIISNRFDQENVPCVWCDNVENLVFKNNAYCAPQSVMAAHSIVNGIIIEKEGAINAE